MRRLSLTMIQRRSQTQSPTCFTPHGTGRLDMRRRSRLHVNMTGTLSFLALFVPSASRRVSVDLGWAGMAGRAEPLLSVVIPVYNEESSIEATIRSVSDQVVASRFGLDLLVVDDGSTDATAEVAGAVSELFGGTVLRQANAGRYASRSAGLAAARGEFVLFIDSRVALHPGSLEYVAARIAEGDDVWNAHVHIKSGGKPYGEFWRVLTELAFADYFAEPRTTSFNEKNFDRFPKGTTCFFAPTELMRTAFGAHRSFYADARNSNDDTPMLRGLSRHRRIHISPQFACSYRSRTTLDGFVRHAFHRGTVFVDGHARRDSRFVPAIACFYPLSIAATLFAMRSPRSASLGVCLCSGGLMLFATGAAAPREKRCRSVRSRPFTGWGTEQACGEARRCWRVLGLPAVGAPPHDPGRLRHDRRADQAGPGPRTTPRPGDG